MNSCSFFVLLLKSVLFQGEKSFFLRPGERLESGIQNLFVLGDDEGLILRAHEEFVQDSKVCLFRNHASFCSNNPIVKSFNS